MHAYYFDNLPTSASHTPPTPSSPSRPKHSPSSASSHRGGGPARMEWRCCTNVQLGSVVRTKLGETTLLIGGKVECKYTGKTDTFVELKTSMVICNHQDEIWFEKKLLKFYMQSFLLGVPVRCAFLFHCVLHFHPSPIPGNPAQEIIIPRLVRGKAHGWNPGRYLAWGEAFLEFLKKHVRERPELGDKGEGDDAGRKGKEKHTHRRGGVVRHLPPWGRR
ncbi:hypothetical protein C8R45DRAFT_1023549 [Mycena sanguinolenta]|nr:hypothetical protein C8R45DRAFT_1023549 [Mycena sanguinolenta]